jgi:hypothetical protein
MSVVTNPPEPTTQTARSWLTIGIVVTVVVLAAGIFFGYRWLSGSGAASTDSTSSTYPQPITALDVKVESGTVTLAPGPDDRTTTVAALSTWDNEKPTVTEQWNGTTLSVTTSCPGSGRCEVDLTITVPAGTPVTTATETGDATVSDLTGPVSVTSGTGEIRLANVSGRVTAETEVGSIKGTALGASQVSATTDSGEVSLGFSADPQSVSATVGTGDITVTVPRSSTAYHVQAHTETGDVRVRVAQDDAASRTIVAHTDTGDVTVDYS